MNRLPSHPRLRLTPEFQRGPLDNSWKVPTPENITFEHRLAGPFPRLIAFGLDILLTQMVYWLVVLIALIGLATLLGAVGPGNDLFAGAFLLLVLVGSFALTWFYGAFCETWYNGQTLGKRLLNLRVLSDDGSAIDGSQATLRNFFRLIDSLPVAALPYLFGLQGPDYQWPQVPTFFLGLVLMTVNQRFQRIGDLVAGTVVVNESQLFQSRMQTLENEGPVQQLAQKIPPDFVINPKLLQALAAYVGRRKRLSRERLLEIASRLSPLLIRELRLPAETDPDLLLCSLYYRGFFTAASDDPK